MDLKIQAPKGINKSLLEDYIRTAMDVLEINGCEIEFQIKKIDRKSDGEDLIKVGGMHPISYDDGRYRFYIEVDEDVPLTRQAVTICHELIHVQQFLNGRLQYGKYVCSMTDLETGEEMQSVIDKGLVWEGKFYPCSTEYKQRPWEVDAKSRQIALANKVNTVCWEKYPDRAVDAGTTQ